MSIRRVDSSSSLESRLAPAAGVGAVLGAGYSVTKKNWLYKDKPSDVFIKNVSNNLEAGITPHQRRESSIINNFLNSVVDSEVNIRTLKPQIRASKELSEAIKSHPAEEVDTAIERVFAEPDNAKLKDSLLELQAKTKSDKLFGKNTALKLVYDNFDEDAKTLKKSENTSEQVFNMLKSTARKIQVKSAVVSGVVTGAIAAGLTLMFTDVDKMKK